MGCFDFLKQLFQTSKPTSLPTEVKNAQPPVKTSNVKVIVKDTKSSDLLKSLGHKTLNDKDRADKTLKFEQEQDARRQAYEAKKIRTNPFLTDPKLKIMKGRK